MNDIVHLDFETKSAIDLREVGAYIYAEHPTTDVWCAAYAFGDEPIKLWVPGQPCPPDLYCHIIEGGIIMAHNASFERAIFAGVMGPRYNWPMPHLSQWRCTMAMAYSMALPGSLEDAAAAVGLDVRKDMAGRRLMLQMCRPRKSNGTCSACNGSGEHSQANSGWACETCKGTGIGFTWWDQPDKLDRLYAYCINDVEVERRLEKRLMALRSQEQEIWFLDQEINDRGVYIDKELCDQAIKVVEDSQKNFDKEIKTITNGAVSSCAAVSQLVTWLKSLGLPVESVNKENILEMLGSWDLPPNARRALELRQEAAKTSTAKIKKMLAMRGADGRMRGNLQYHGAGTGRWAARGAQLQNLPRPQLKDVPEAINLILKSGSAQLIDMIYGSPLNVVADCIRGMIASPPGHDIIAADFSNIEGRVLAWLAGQANKLDAYRAYDAGTGPDLYLVAASGIFGTNIENAKPFRQIGKVAELALGYQGGPAAFGKMAGNYGLHIGDHFETIWDAASEEHKGRALDGYESRGKKSDMSQQAWLAAEVIKVAWRDFNPNIVNLWYSLENAAMDAVLNPGQQYQVGKIAYKMSGSFLWCRLPSGRVLCYPYPRIREVETSWGKREAIVYKCVDGITRKWQDKAFYGGLAAENITQAVARDLMAEAMIRVDAAGYKVIITIHDEVVCEIPESFGSVEEFNKLMISLPNWAFGCPVMASGWRDKRYRK